MQHTDMTSRVNEVGCQFIVCALGEFREGDVAVRLDGGSH